MDAPDRCRRGFRRWTAGQPGRVAPGLNLDGSNGGPQLLILFIVFAGLALGSGLAMIVQRNAVHAALLLVVNLLSVAVLFLTLGAEFLFVAQIIVYTGAIVVLFIFVIMLLGVDRSEVLGEPRRFQARQVILGSLVGLALVGALGMTLTGATMATPLPEVPDGFGSAESIGLILFQRFLLPFELTALLLLVATIGILMLAKRKKAT
jgi:NADH-quinone oxidoreductase subunit J